MAMKRRGKFFLVKSSKGLPELYKLAQPLGNHAWGRRADEPLPVLTFGRVSRVAADSVNQLNSVDATGGFPGVVRVLRAIVFLVMAVGINLPFPAPAGNTTIFRRLLCQALTKAGPG